MGKKHGMSTKGDEEEFINFEMKYLDFSRVRVRTLRIRHGDDRGSERGQ